MGKKKKEKKASKEDRLFKEKKTPKEEKLPKEKKAVKEEKLPKKKKAVKEEKLLKEKLPKEKKALKEEKLPKEKNALKEKELPNEKKIGKAEKGSRESILSAPEAAGIFRALGDESRMQILRLLEEQELCATELLQSLDIVQSTLSHHMKILTDTGLVICRRDGKKALYSICLEKMEQAAVFLKNYRSHEKSSKEE